MVDSRGDSRHVRGSVSTNWMNPIIHPKADVFGQQTAISLLSGILADSNCTPLFFTNFEAADSLCFSPRAGASEAYAKGLPSCEIYF